MEKRFFNNNSINIEKSTNPLLSFRRSKQIPSSFEECNSSDEISVVFSNRIKDNITKQFHSVKIKETAKDGIMKL